jgi:hypothetical protein
MKKLLFAIACLCTLGSQLCLAAEQAPKKPLQVVVDFDSVKGQKPRKTPHLNEVFRREKMEKFNVMLHESIQRGIIAEQKARELTEQAEQDSLSAWGRGSAVLNAAPVTEDLPSAALSSSDASPKEDRLLLWQSVKALSIKPSTSDESDAISPASQQKAADLKESLVTYRGFHAGRLSVASKQQV